MATPRKAALTFHISPPDPDEQEHVVQGRFEAPATNAWLRLDENLEAAQHSAKTYQAYFTKLERLIAKEPDYFNAYNYVGNAHLDLATKEKFPAATYQINQAEKYYSLAFERAKALIPPDFTGQIVWSYIENRPFLRSHHGLILCHLRRKEYAAAAEKIEQHLRWNPGDNIGVRYLLGDAYLLAGDTGNARRVFAGELAENLHPYPSNAYSLGLVEFRAGNYSAAATALRVGFIGNMYIAEMLTGRTVDKPHFFWHGHSWATVSYAKEYLNDQEILPLLQSIPQALDFVDWLYNCATVMREHLDWAEIKEGLTYEQDLDKRGLYCERDNELRLSIPKVAMLIQKVTTLRGEQRWPWEHSRTDLVLEQG
jgi:tetratricopeptide (TPR) repeat protein